jgi:hypothetical protein
VPVRAAKLRAKPHGLSDANRLDGLVTPSGGELWRWNYDRRQAEEHGLRRPENRSNIEC